ncbi:MAG: proton-conducting transporter membrane subunit [Halobacteriales archaeon]
MTEVTSLRPLLAVAVAAATIGLVLASHRRPNVREGWSLLAAVSMFIVVASMVPGVLEGTVFAWRYETFVPHVDLALRADPLGMVFALLASGLWIVATVYSIGYMRGLEEHAQTRYFAAFAGSLAAAVGVAFAANLVTIFVFYELLSVATYPLVAHDETREARLAGRKYFAYTFLGGGVLVLGGAAVVFWLTGAHGDPTTAFSAGGIEALAVAADADPWAARGGFALLSLGFGVKAALIPLHSWLPDAMVAPTPVSGLLHAVAVVKSGVFGIARVVLDVYGLEVVGALDAALPLAAMAAFTIVAASVVALRQDNLKRRLAYSTVSQLSYIVLGLAVAAAGGAKLAVIGGLLHIPAHGFMKLTLFLCAGAIHVETHTDDVSEMAGIGRRMPLTMAAFAVAAAGMAGMPLVAGFVSKLYLLLGTLEAGALIFTAALLLSGILNVAYFWPVVYTAFFEGPATTDHDPKPILEHLPGGGHRVLADGHGATGGWEPRGWRGDESTWFLIGPILAVAVCSVVLGIVPEQAVFLRLVELVAEGVTP